MLVVKNVAKSLGNKEILHNINFCLKKGQVVALVGPNGAGKTTLMRLLCGFYKQEHGEISFDNLTIENNRTEFLKNIAYVPENGGIYPDMSVFEFLKFMANAKHLTKDVFDKNIKKVIKNLELESVINQKCETLSKGFKRRVAIAGAMLSEPKVLILDEPTEGLDPYQKLKLREVLQDYGKKNIVLISTHIMEEVEAMATRVLMIKKGKLVCDSTPADLKKITSQNKIEESFYTIVGDIKGDK